MHAYGPFPPPTEPPDFLKDALDEIDEMIAEKGDHPYLLKERAAILKMLEAYNA